MPRNIILVLIALFLLFLIAISCSGKTNPISSEKIRNLPGDTHPGPNSNYNPAKWSSATVPFWVLSGSINTQRQSARLDPVRSPLAIGDMFDADITQFLLKNPCADCVKISGVGLDSSGTQLIMKLQVKHPFENIAKRPDLHAFDVRAILQTGESIGYNRITSDLNGDGVAYQSEAIYPGGNYVTNADGFTTHFNTGRFSTNCHPFKRFFVNPSTGHFDPNNPSGHNVMKVGSPWETQEFHIDISKAPSYIEFDLIIDASYAQSATFATRSNPMYYLPAYNRKEAWSVETSIADNKLAGGDTQTFADIEVRVKDWQAGAIVNASYPDCQLSEIPYESNVKEVVIDIPGVNSTSFDSVVTPVSGAGSDSDPYVFLIRIHNDLAAAEGSYTGLAAVRDDLYLLQGPSGIPEGRGGFPEAKPDIRDYTAYAYFTIDVGEGVINPPPPPGDIEINGPTTVFVGETIQLTASTGITPADFEWSTDSTDIELVGSTTDETVQIKGISPSASLGSARVNVGLTGGEAAAGYFDLTCWSLEFDNPSTARSQYVNLDGGGQNGRTLTLQLSIVPSGMGEKQITWSFVDPDEPSQPSAVDESMEYETDTNGDDNRGAEDPGFGNNLTGTNPDTYVATTQSGSAQAPFIVSMFGGDNYIIKACPDGVSASLAVESPVITVWRWIDVPVYSMESSSGTDYYYQPYYAAASDLFADGYVHVNATVAQGGLPYNSGGASDGAVALDAPAFWPVTEVPIINYLLSNSNAIEGWHKVNMCGFRKFGNPAPAGVNPENVLGIAWSYWQNPEPDPFHFMYYNYFFVCTGRITDFFGSSDEAELHVFVHEFAHTMGLPHNNLEEGDTGHDPFYPNYKWTGGLGVMSATTSQPINNKFSRAELDFLRGAYDGPYFY
jgi:hypothetical protein